ncbi:MAG: hypothetical protein ACFE9N_12250 [Promethearchaeota archaeon]
MEVTKQEEIERIDQAELKRRKRVNKTRKLSLIAGILTIISLFIPYALAERCIAYNFEDVCIATNTHLIFQFGLSLTLPLGLEWAWFPIVAIGIFATIFLTTGGVMLTVTAVMAKAKELAKFEVYWKTSGKLILVSPILLVFYLVMRTDTYFQNYELFIPFIGIVIPIISGVIALLAGRRAGKF